MWSEYRVEELATGLELRVSLTMSTSLVAQLVKNLPHNVGDLGSTPGLGRSPREGNGNPFQYSLENPMDGGDW